MFYLFFTFYNFGGVFGAQLNVCGVFFFSFFVKIVDGFKLVIVFANDLGFDISLGYEFAFEFALSQ